MIQTGTMLKIIDNSGAKTAICIKVKQGYRSRYAYMGDTVMVSVRSLRLRRREAVKVKKGELFSALIVRTRFPDTLFHGDKFSYLEQPAAILLTKQGKILGTRIFGAISKTFRISKFTKVLSLSSGVNV